VTARPSKRVKISSPSAAYSDDGPGGRALHAALGSRAARSSVAALDAPLDPPLAAATARIVGLASPKPGRAARAPPRAPHRARGFHRHARAKSGGGQDEGRLVIHLLGRFVRSCCSVEASMADGGVVEHQDHGIGHQPSGIGAVAAASGECTRARTRVSFFLTKKNDAAASTWRVTMCHLRRLHHMPGMTHAVRP